MAETRVKRQRFLALLVIATLTLVPLTHDTGRAANVGTGSISGTVYRDYNQNGIRDTGGLGTARDHGVVAVIVRAFDATGRMVADTATATDGTYTLTIADAASDEIRVEFSFDDDHLDHRGVHVVAAITTGATNSLTGARVQFAVLGDTNVDVGVSRPDEYCQNSPNIAVSRQCLNSAAAPTLWVSHYDGGPYNVITNLATTVDNRWDDNDLTNVYTDWTANNAGNAGQTGSILGVAWDARSGQVISSAYVRSWIPLYEDPNGKPLPAALFSTTPNGTSAGTTGGSTRFLVDLETLLPGDQFSNSTPTNPTLTSPGFTGYIPSNAARKLFEQDVTGGPDSDIPGGSTGVYEEVGKAGIGGITTDSDGNLYVVSLYTRELYRVVLPADGSVPTVMESVGLIVAPVSCPIQKDSNGDPIEADGNPLATGEPRPFGVTFWRDDLYMGVVCDGAEDYDPANPTGVSDRNLTYQVVRFRPADATWDLFVGPFPLYAPTPGGLFKGSPISERQPGPADNSAWRWNAWTDTFSPNWAAHWGPVHPMPMPSGLEFDRDGSLVVSLRDRTSDRMTQFFTGALFPDGTAHDEKGGISAGDIYRICRTGPGFSHADYVWEGGDGCTQNFNNGTNNVPEYYRDDYGAPGVGHPDQSAGMLTYVPGMDEVLNTSMDPHTARQSNETFVSSQIVWSSGGVSYYLNATGDRQTAINSGGGVIYFSHLATLEMNDGTFGKIAGMGDLEALCERPTVEIGDRVWFDTNQNGIQDADEPGIAGVTVRLYDTSGNLLAETLTGTDGSYRFGFNEGVRAGSDYVIRLDNPDDYASGGPLAGLQLTARSVNTSQDALANEVDSSARLTTAGLFSRSYPTMMVGALTAGINNYTFDAGFVVPPPPPPTGSITGTVFTDLAETGLFTGSEPVHVGLQIELKDSDGAPVVDSTGAIVPVFMTGSDGNYQFTNLPVGTYTVRFVSQTPDGMRLLVAVHTVVVSFSMLHHVAVDFPLRPDSPSLPLAEPPIPTQVPAGSGPLDLVSFWLLFVVAAGVVLQYAGHNHIIFRKAKQT